MWAVPRPIIALLRPVGSPRLSVPIIAAQTARVFAAGDLRLITDYLFRAAPIVDSNDAGGDSSVSGIGDCSATMCGQSRICSRARLERRSQDQAIPGSEDMTRGDFGPGVCAGMATRQNTMHSWSRPSACACPGRLRSSQKRKEVRCGAAVPVHASSRWSRRSLTPRKVLTESGV